jgi:hypothetical protein
LGSLHTRYSLSTYAPTSNPHIKEKEMLRQIYSQDETTARYLPFRTYVWCKPVLDRKIDRNADTLQQTITDVGEHDPALQATGRTATNSHGQSMPYPPFGMPKISFEPRHNSSEATSGLRLLVLTSIQQLYSNGCTKSISGAREMLKCRTATERKLQRAKYFLRRMKQTKDNSSTLDFLCEC